MSLVTENNDETIALRDTEKAFDRVNWTFLFAALYKFGFANSIINLIKTLYNSPRTTVTTRKFAFPAKMQV